MNDIFTRICIFTIIFLYIFNPYTAIGPLGSYVSVFFAIIGVTKVKIKLNDIYIFMCLETIALVGVMSSYSNGIGQWNHLLVVNLLIMNYMSAIGLMKVFPRILSTYKSLLGFVVLAIVANAVVILIQVISTEFRAAIESLLVASGNRDWRQGFRYRGLASSGGASLSVLFSVGVLLLFYSYHVKAVGLIRSIAGIVLIFLALLVVGRTGLILAIIFSFISLIVILYDKPSILLKMLMFSVITAIAIGAFFPVIESFLIEQFGAGFINYSYGFMFSGSEGLRNEGTAAVLLSFLSVMPMSYPEIIVGFGFYGGSEFETWTDSGLARMFLSVGIPFGVLFYMLYFSLFVNAFKKSGIFLLLVFALLSIAELKEGMLFSGYGARVFILIAVFMKYKRELFAVKSKVHSV